MTTRQDLTPLGVIQLVLSTVQSTKDEKANTFKLITPTRTYYFEADSAPEVDSWVDTIKDTCSKLVASNANVTFSTSSCRRFHFRLLATHYLRETFT